MHVKPEGQPFLLRSTLLRNGGWGLRLAFMAESKILE